MSMPISELRTRQKVGIKINTTSRLSSVPMSREQTHVPVVKESPFLVIQDIEESALASDIAIEATRPSMIPNEKNQKSGKETIIDPGQKAQEVIDSLKKENKAAKILAKMGYKVEQNPEIKGTEKKPDYKIEGVVFDCYSPAESTAARNIVSAIDKKVRAGQTQRIVLNLDGWRGDEGEILEWIKGRHIEELEEILVVKDETVHHLFVQEKVIAPETTE